MAIKKYLFKVFDKNYKYLTTWDDAEFRGFRKQINGGLGELNLTLPRKFSDFDEGLSVNVGNIVEIWLSDSDVPEKLIYSGYISSYSPYIEEEREGVEVSCLGFLTLYAFLLYKNGNNVTIKHNSYDPSDIAKDIVNRVRAEYADDVLATMINYTSNSIVSTQTTVSYTFTTATALEALQKTQELAPFDWYFYVGADNLLNFKQVSQTAKHTFTYGKDFRKINVFKNVEAVRNYLLFWNSRSSNDEQAISRLYYNDSSKDKYGYRFEKATDGRVTDLTTANKWGQAFIEANKNIEIQTKVEIVDNNVDTSKGYDIDSIEPGDTCRFANLPEVVSRTFTDNMLIVAVDYTPTSAIIEVESQGVALQRKLNKIKRDLVEEQYDTAQQPPYDTYSV